MSARCSVASSIPKLFQPIRVGTASLQHRVVLAPMTRNRADSQHVPGPLGWSTTSSARASPATLAITEATFIAPQAGGYPNVPGIWSDEQVAGWKPVRHDPFPFPRVRSEMPLAHALGGATDRGRGAQKRVVYLPPALGTRTHRATGRPERRGTPSSRRARSPSLPIRSKGDASALVGAGAAP
jgi:hypothetical protein